MRIRNNENVEGGIIIMIKIKRKKEKSEV